MLPCTTAWFSSGVPLSRLLDANLGRSERTNWREKRPLASNMATPSFGPKVLDPGLVLVLEASVQLPTSWVLLIFVCWPTASLAYKASPSNSAIVVVFVRAASPFIVFLDTDKTEARTGMRTYELRKP